MVRRIAILGVVLAAALAGCKDDGKAKLKEIRDKACACKDATCVAALDKDLAAVAKMTTADPDGAAVIRDELVACVAKVGQ
ncbi:MAG: hypothetical protein K8W52_30170 [Deltaproteobacteria bacterium]|nr:hypothetical protein [Deltaproteobacteria bacterium]